MVAYLSFIFHNNHLNYGATLQGFAFQKVLDKMRVRSIAVDYLPREMEGYHDKFPILNIIRPPVTLRRIILCFVNFGLGFMSNLTKYRKFQVFFRKYFIKTHREYRGSDLQKGIAKLENHSIDVWCVESDVIWKMNGGYDIGFFLDFPLPPNVRRVAYAASMGSRPLHEQKDGARALASIRKFDAISVREREGAEYLSGQLGMTVDLVLDPTLLLTAKEYEDNIELPECPVKDKYILVYNCMRNDLFMCYEAEKYATAHGLKMIEVSVFGVNKFGFRHSLRIANRTVSFKFHHKVLTDVGVEEWLSLIKHAEAIFANSFHGACFSIVFRRPFLCFQRDKTDTKMENLTRELGLPDCLVRCDRREDVNIPEVIDFEDVERRLEGLRSKSVQFLKGSFDL